MLEQRVVKARSEINDRCLRFGYHLDGDRVLPGQRQDACAGLQVSDNAVQRTTVERDERDVLQRPAHPCCGETEGGWLRQAYELVGGDKCRELLANAEMKGVAARENDDRSPPMSFDLAERIAHGTWPGERPATNKIAREFQMARTADDEFRRVDQATGNGGQPFQTVLTDTDDRQPTLLRAGCGLRTHWRRPRCAF